MYYSGIFLGGLGKTKENLSPDSWYSAEIWSLYFQNASEDLIGNDWDRFQDDPGVVSYDGHMQIYRREAQNSL
jgi:hypothetical protein